MTYPNSYSYNSFYRPNPSFHPPTFFLNVNDYTQPTHSFFTSYPPIWCNYCQNPSHPLEQCPSIGYLLELGQNQFHTFQGLTSEAYPSNFNSGGQNYSDLAWDQSYINTQSNQSCTEPTPPSWGLDYEQEEMCRRLTKQKMNQNFIRVP